MLLVQKYLEENTFGQLASEHGVYAKFDKLGYKCSLNYDQIEAVDSNPIAQECRGLILSTQDGHSLLPQAIIENDKPNYDAICPGPMRIISFPFRRFFNYGQGAAKEIKWNDPKLSIFGKLDGSLTPVYFDPFVGKWCVSTRAVCEADQLMDNGRFTFRTLFEKALFETNGMDFDTFTSQLNPQFTYCFELTSPYNRVVCEYKDTHITLLAARNNITLQEIDIDTITIGVPCVHKYNLNNIEDILEYVSSQHPSEHEGVVVCDGEFNRIKVKNPAYVLAHKLKDTISASPRNLVECVLLEKSDDVIPLLPQELVDEILLTKDKIKQLIHKYDIAYSSMVAELGETTQKEFAIAVQKSGLWQAPLFRVHAKKADNMHDFIMKARNDHNVWADSFLDKILEMIS